VGKGKGEECRRGGGVAQPGGREEGARPAGGLGRPCRVCPVGQRLREGEEVGGPRDRLSGPKGWLGRRGRKIKRNGGWLVGRVKGRER
jgi:hypothetical protein